MKKNSENFNIVIVGVGGQGLITLLQIIAEAALIEGFDVKTSELHGLSQRGGSIQTHIRFGQKVNSPLVPLGRADLILALESLESLRAFPYISSATTFLVNNCQLFFEGALSEKEIVSKLRSLPNKKILLIPASKICQEELKSEVVGGVYLLGKAVSKKLIPLKSDSIIKAIKKTVGEKYFEINKKAFNLARS